MFLALLDPHPDPLVRGTDRGSGSGSVPKCHEFPTLTNTQKIILSLMDPDFFFCQDACKRCCRRNLNSSCNAVAPVDILPDGTPCFQVQPTASAADPDP